MEPGRFSPGHAGYRCYSLGMPEQIGSLKSVSNPTREAISAIARLCEIVRTPEPILEMVHS